MKAKKNKVGRPRKPLPKKYAYTTRLTENEVDYLKRLCERYDKTAPEIMRGAIRFMYANRWKVDAKLHWCSVEEQIREAEADEADELVESGVIVG